MISSRNEKLALLIMYLLTDIQFSATFVKYLFISKNEFSRIVYKQMIKVSLFF